MRIVAGKWRARSIGAPKGTTTRPTSDRVREALFSSLTSYFGTWDDVVVLDAFAGSGALGLEALSRGAAHATFAEKDRHVLVALKDNIRNLDAKDDCTVLASDITSAATQRRIARPCSLLLLDPPYRINKSEVRGLVEALTTLRRLTEGAVVVWEHASGEEVDWPAFVEPYDRKRYGSTTLDIGIAHPNEEAS